MYVSSDLDERTLREIYLRGFEIAVREGKPKAVMSAYNKINNVYCANNRELCTDVLRKAYRKGQLRKETVCRSCARVLEQILTE